MKITGSVKDKVRREMAQKMTTQDDVLLAEAIKVMKASTPQGVLLREMIQPQLIKSLLSLIS